MRDWDMVVANVNIEALRQRVARLDTTLGFIDLDNGGIVVDHIKSIKESIQSF